MELDKLYSYTLQEVERSGEIVSEQSYRQAVASSMPERYLEAIGSGEMSAIRAKIIITSAKLRVPDQIMTLAFKEAKQSGAISRPSIIGSTKDLTGALKLNWLYKWGEIFPKGIYFFSRDKSEPSKVYAISENTEIKEENYDLKVLGIKDLEYKCGNEEIYLLKYLPWIDKYLKVTARYRIYGRFTGSALIEDTANQKKALTDAQTEVSINCRQHPEKIDEYKVRIYQDAIDRGKYQQAIKEDRVSEKDVIEILFSVPGVQIPLSLEELLFKAPVITQLKLAIEAIREQKGIYRKSPLYEAELKDANKKAEDYFKGGGTDDYAIYDFLDPLPDRNGRKYLHVFAFPHKELLSGDRFFTNIIRIVKATTWDNYVPKIKSIIGSPVDLNGNEKIPEFMTKKEYYKNVMKVTYYETLEYFKMNPPKQVFEINKLGYKKDIYHIWNYRINEGNPEYYRSYGRYRYRYMSVADVYGAIKRESLLLFKNYLRSYGNIVNKFRHKDGYKNAVLKEQSISASDVVKILLDANMENYPEFINFKHLADRDYEAMTGEKVISKDVAEERQWQKFKQEYPNANERELFELAERVAASRNKKRDYTDVLIAGDWLYNFDNILNSWKSWEAIIFWISLQKDKETLAPWLLKSLDINKNYNYESSLVIKGYEQLWGGYENLEGQAKSYMRSYIRDNQLNLRDSAHIMESVIDGTMTELIEKIKLYESKKD